MVEKCRPELGADFVLGFGRTVAQDVHRAGGGCHAVYVRLLAWPKRWSLKNRLELSLERELYTSEKTRHFVVNSAMVGSQLEEVYGVSTEKLSTIHTPVDTAHFHPPPAPTTNNRPVILFVSSNHRRKGLDALLAAFAELRDAELIIAGAPLGARYRSLIRRLSLADRVRALGPVTDLAPIFREADFFVHPTLYDACANAALQAMASGLPSLISIADGASEFITPGKNGFLLRAPADAAALHAQLAAALTLEPEARSKIGSAARARMLPLTWEAHLEAWTRLFEKLSSARQSNVRSH
jgi:UDP-glucose:(heptosyl)LPS alpha-1,3-glucosyltransferase